MQSFLMQFDIGHLAKHFYFFVIALLPIRHTFWLKNNEIVIILSIEANDKYH